MEMRYVGGNRMKKVFAFLAQGFEETEALMVIDLLRRSSNVEVTTVSITDELMVESSHKFKIMCDALIKEIHFEEGDMIFLPGGVPGTPNLEACDSLKEAIIKYYKEGKYLAAICAAPSIYSHLGLLKDKKATSHGSFAGEMDCKEYGGQVVTDGQFITANGLGSALEMGLELVTILSGEEEARKIAKAIHYIK